MSTTPQRTGTDQQLLRRIAEHDRAALGDLYDFYAPLLFPVMLHILGDPAEAGHALRTLFLDLWESRATFDLTFGGSETWLIRLARDQAVKVLRELPPASRPEPQSGSPALDGLPERQRRLVAAAYYGGATVAELAARFGMDESSVRRELRDGMAELRKKVQKKEDPS